jgi:hypothetical protein
MTFPIWTVTARGGDPNKELVGAHLNLIWNRCCSPMSASNTIGATAWS